MWRASWHDEGVDDRALVDAVRAGDRDAFGAFVELETRAVYRACLRILGRPHDAEDVTQEAFVAAFRSIGSYRGEGPLRGGSCGSRRGRRSAGSPSAGRRPTSTPWPSRSSPTRARIRPGSSPPPSSGTRFGTRSRRCPSPIARSSRCGSSVSSRWPRSPMPPDGRSTPSRPTCVVGSSACARARHAGRGPMTRHPFDPDELDRDRPGAAIAIGERLERYAADASR